MADKHLLELSYVSYQIISSNEKSETNVFEDALLVDVGVNPKNYKYKGYYWLRDM